MLTAIYFAVSEHPDESGRLFALSPQKLNDRQCDSRGIFPPGHPQINELARPPFSRSSPNPDKIAAFFPMEVDTRMLLQQSCFTMHGPGIPIEALDYHDEILIRWDIPRTAKADIRSELSYLGVNESTLFPDLEHLAKFLKETV